MVAYRTTARNAWRPRKARRPSYAVRPRTRRTFHTGQFCFFFPLSFFPLSFLCAVLFLFYLLLINKFLYFIFSFYLLLFSIFFLFFGFFSFIYPFHVFYYFLLPFFTFKFSIYNILYIIFCSINEIFHNYFWVII